MFIFRQLFHYWNHHLWIIYERERIRFPDIRPSLPLLFLSQYHLFSYRYHSLHYLKVLMIGIKGQQIRHILFNKDTNKQFRNGCCVVHKFFQKGLLITIFITIRIKTNLFNKDIIKQLR